VTGWKLHSILEEYRGHAEPKVRDCDIKYITAFQVASLQGLFSRQILRQPDVVLTDARMARLITFVAIILSIWLTTILLW